MENDRLERIEDMVETLIRMVGENNSRVTTLEEAVKSLDERMDAFEGRMDRLETDVSEIKEMVKEIMRGQERQDRILEMLAVKSIETDSYIQEFKRKIV